MAAVTVVGVVATGSAASAAGAITVTPRTDLVDGETVTVQGTGWVPFASVAYCQAVVVGGPDPSDCANGGYFVRSVDSDGSFSVTMTVRRVIHVPGLGLDVDCADPTNPCVIGAADITDVPGTTTVATLEFEPGPARVVPGGASIAEGSSGTTTLEVPVRLSFPTDETVTADWTTATAAGAPPGVADPATDFTPVSGTLTFDPGDTEESIPITVDADALVEPDEWIVIAVANPINAVMGGYWGLGFGIIANDDEAVVLPGGATVVEGDVGPAELELPVAMSNPSTFPVTVEWTTGTDPGAPMGFADPAADFTPSSGTVTFAPGQTDQVVSIDVTGDTLDEPDEWLIVSFHDPTNARMGGFWGLGFGLITDDD